MIITRTPYRISFFGGGTDYPAWFRERGGAVLATTINRYCYLTVRHLPPFFEHRIRIAYSKLEHCQTIDEIAHPAVRAVLGYLDLDRGLEIHHDGDLPARSGLGSSSAFTVGLLHACHALKGQMPSKRQLAEESIYIEQEILQETVGCQDQVLAAYGGTNHITFTGTRRFNVQPITLPQERLDALNDSLMLFFTGISRISSTISSTYDMKNRDAELHRMREMVDEGLAILNSREDLAQFGELLHEGWERKKSLSPHVTNETLETIYREARAAGAVGGKVIGAGGGGFMLLFAPPERRRAVRARLMKLLHVPFKFEHLGTQVIFYEAEQEESPYRDE